jgi:hypothetical protein
VRPARQRGPADRIAFIYEATVIEIVVPGRAATADQAGNQLRGEEPSVMPLPP